MQLNNFDLRILVKDKSINEYGHQGRTFIEGRKGSEFQVEFKNNTNGRVLVVPSVDGLSTLDGQLATPDSKGYVVGPWATLTVPGWTVDGQSVANFLFNDKEKSYAAYSSQGTTNAGVIGVLVFAEKVTYVAPAPIIRQAPYWPKSPTIYPNHPWDIRPTVTYGNAGAEGQMRNAASMSVKKSSLSAEASATSASADSESPFGLGTGWGQKAEFKTTQTTFDKGALAAQLVIYYDTRKNLEKRGIEVVKRNTAALDELPQAFPTIGCKPPPGWNG